MKKAMRQVAGTAVLGVALAAAAVTPAAADGLGGALGSLPTGGLPTVSGLPAAPVQELATGPVSDGRQVLGSQTGSVHAVTGTAQGLVDTAAPSVQSATKSLPGLGAPAATRALPVSLAGGLPVVGTLAPTGDLPALGQPSGTAKGGLDGVTSGLPLQSPLG